MYFFRMQILAAGLRFELQGLDCSVISHQIHEYLCRCFITADKDAGWRIRFLKTPSSELEGLPWNSSDQIMWWEEPEELRVIFNNSYLNFNWSQATVLVSPVNRDRWGMDDFASCMNSMLAILVVYEGGLAMHAAAVGYGENAALFFGHSGAGKSTLARLICPPAKIISDDFCLLRPIANGEGFAVHGSPFKADSSIATVAVRPSGAVKKMFSVRKSTGFRIEPLPMQKMYPEMMCHLYYLPQSNDLCSRIMNCAERLCRKAFCATLWFAPQTFSLREAKIILD